MEQKLKRQRKKLFLRITLILLAVWVTLSFVYCAILIYSEKNSVQRKELEKLSHVTQSTDNAIFVYESYDYFFRNCRELLYDEKTGLRDWDTQVILKDRKTKEMLADSMGKEIVNFGFKSDPDHPSAAYGFIACEDFRRRISDEDFQKIEQLLSTKSEAGGSYELICSKFAINNFDFTPAELEIVLIGDENQWAMYDEVIETFELESSDIPQEYIVPSNEMQRNVIPSSFFGLDGSDNNIIASLTDEQRENSVEMIPTGMFEYIFYSFENINLKYTDIGSESFTMQYAKKINILELCGTKIIAGISLMFGFFFVIGVILCLSVWKIIETQTISEKNRTELTNALAHDIKTPLFVISGYAYSLKENIDETERDNYLDKIIEQTDRINTLVHNMLNLSKLDSYNVTLNKTEFDLSELTEELLKDYRILPNGKTLKYTQSGDNTVTADRSLITTALHNLIDNAVQYSLPETEIVIVIKDNSLRIENQCEPLSKSEIKQIWQPYVRKDKSRHQKGNGLGLSIVKSIFDLHKIGYEMKMEETSLVCVINF